MKSKHFTNEAKLKGTVTRRLFHADRLNKVKKLAFAGMIKTKRQMEELLDWASKPMFAENFVWSFLKKTFDVDLKIPFITGYWTKQAVKGNLVVTVGKQAVAQQTGGTTTAPVTAIAIGTGTVAAAAADTTLGTEITTAGGARGAATVTNTTTTTTGDTEQWVKTFTFTATFAVTEEGILDNNTSGGVLLARQVFSAVNVVSGDSLQVTHTLKIS